MTAADAAGVELEPGRRYRVAFEAGPLAGDFIAVFIRYSRDPGRLPEAVFDTGRVTLAPGVAVDEVPYP